LVDIANTTKILDDLAMTEVSATIAPGLYKYVWIPSASGSYAAYMFEGTIDNPTWLQTEEVEVSSSTSSVTYTTVAAISLFLGLRDNEGNRLSISGETIPSSDDVSDIILEVEDFIDQYTHHSWRSTTVSNEVYDYMPPECLGYGERADQNRSICLKHRKIRTFSHADGDKLEVWNGSAWIDYLTAYTEGRGLDFWVDYEMGILFFGRQYPTIREKSVRVTCRYGESTVPRDIQRATKMLVAVEMLSGDEGNNVMSTGQGGLTMKDRLEKWNEKAMEILQTHMEVQ